MSSEQEKKAKINVANNLIDAVLTCSMLYLIIALPLSLLRIPHTGFLHVMYVQIAIALCLCALFLRKDKIADSIKATILSSMFFILGWASIHTFGLSSVGLFFFFASSMVARIITSAKFSVLISILGTAVGFVYLVLMYSGGYTFSVPQSDYNQSVPVWLITLSLFLYLNTTCLYVVETLTILLENKDRVQAKVLDSHKNQLSYSNSILNHIINNLPFSIIWKDTNLVIQGANTRFLDEHNQSNIVSLQGESDIGLFGVDDAKSRHEIEHSLLERTYQRFNYQTQFTNSNEEVVHIEIRHNLMLDSKNQAIGILITETDITKYIKLKQVTDLGLSEKEKLKSTKSTFLANVSHEIRTPLNGINGMLQLIQSTSITQQQNKYLDNIESSVFMLDQILSDLLDISKIEAGELRIERAPFDMDKLIHDLVRVFKVKASNKHIEFIVSVENEVNEILIGDSKRLVQILSNLVKNAIKFTLKGEVKLTISVKLKQDSVIAKFYVIDTGIGFDVDKINHLFTSFTQNDSLKTRRFGGNGLGLPIVKNLVDMMNGHIKVSSEINNGSQFTVSIPFTLSKRKSDLAIGNSKPNDSKTLKILLVEDNEINQEIALGMLDLNNFEITVASDGKKALEVLKANNFDIILMDIQMPVMDGVTATTEIRKTYTAEQLPIIAVTANVMESEVQDYLEKGFSSHVGKPYNRSAILGAIKHIVANNIDRRTANYF